MCSYPSARGLKSQLPVEQPSTGGCWNLPKKKNAPCPKTKKQQQWDGRRGTILIKSNSTNWRTIIQRSSPTVVTIPNPTSGFPAWGPDKRTGNPQGLWRWSPAGSDYKTGLGETETPDLEGINKILHAPRLRGKEQGLHRKLNQNYQLGLEGVLLRHGSAGAHCRDRVTGRSCQGRFSLA